LRKLTHRHYLIFYQVNETARRVEVVRIWDGRQNPASLRLP
jgi:plasmid stabilization system protein ParE